MIIKHIRGHFKISSSSAPMSHIYIFIYMYIYIYISYTHWVRDHLWIRPANERWHYIVISHWCIHKKTSVRGNQNQWSHSIWRCSLTTIEICIIKIRWSYNHLIPIPQMTVFILKQCPVKQLMFLLGMIFLNSSSHFIYQYVWGRPKCIEFVINAVLL